MPTTDSSPRITHVSWGRLEVEPPSDDGPQSFKDAKLYPGGARAWDWNETGTSHTPGIQPADVEELLEHGASVVVLSRGMNQRLQVKPETLDRLDARAWTSTWLPPTGPSSSTTSCRPPTKPLRASFTRPASLPSVWSWTWPPPRGLRRGRRRVRSVFGGFAWTRSPTTRRRCFAP
jgi:hypothetical protein